MSFKSICLTLAITASVSMAEKMKLAELMNLQTQLVDELDLGHTEPEVDHKGDSKHREHIPHYNTALERLTMDHETVDADGHCPIGFARVGCCKCIHDIHADAGHLGGRARVEEEEFTPTIHGMHGVVHGVEHETNTYE